MPVLDHATHPSTVMPADYRHGCYNRKVAEGYWAPDGYCVVIGAIEYSWVPNTFSKECRFDHSLTDPACAGCKWQGSGEAYAAKIRGEGK